MQDKWILELIGSVRHKMSNEKYIGEENPFILINSNDYILLEDKINKEWVNEPVYISLPYFLKNLAERIKFLENELLNNSKNICNDDYGSMLSGKRDY